MIIRPIDRRGATYFLSRYHYLKDKPFRASRIYGMFDDTKLVGVCVFHGPSAPETVVGAFGLDRTDQSGIYELGRLAIHPDLNGGNHTSWFVSRCLKQLRKDTTVRAVISYADSSAGHVGSIYRACNAYYCGMTYPHPDYYKNGVKVERFVKGEAQQCEKRPRPQKHRYVWLYDHTLVLRWPVVSCNMSGIPKDIKGSVVMV